VIALILGALVAVAAVVIVSLPFLRQTDEPDLLDTRETQDRLALLEARDRALAALKELEFDHRTGKVDDVDYRELVGPLRRAAADALQALDRRDAAARSVEQQPAEQPPEARPAEERPNGEPSAEERLPEKEDVQAHD
jgi:hypothetical protein